VGDRVITSFIPVGNCFSAYAASPTCASSTHSYVPRLSAGPDGPQGRRRPRVLPDLGTFAEEMIVHRPSVRGGANPLPDEQLALISGLAGVTNRGVCAVFNTGQRPARLQQSLSSLRRGWPSPSFQGARIVRAPHASSP